MARLFHKYFLSKPKDVYKTSERIFSVGQKNAVFRCMYTFDGIPASRGALLAELYTIVQQLWSIEPNEAAISMTTLWPARSTSKSET